MLNHGHVSIVGAGIAGLAAAIAMARRGNAVTVYEKAAAFEPAGAGIQLGPNAVRALQKLGAWAAVEPITYAPPAIHLRSGVSGKLIKEIRLGASFEKRFGQPYRVAHRADLHAGLLAVVETLPSVFIKMGKDVDTKLLDGPVIAADGIRSKTREQLFPGSAAVKTAHTAFRALLPMPQNKDIDFSCVNLWFYPGAHVVHYPAGMYKRLNLVAITQETEPLQQFAKAAPALLKFLETVPGWSRWPLAFVTPLQQWHKGKVFLIGDAAHGTLPYLAQGAAMSLEDAAALLQVNSHSEFVENRYRRCLKLHQRSLAAGRTYHFGPLASNVRDIGLKAIGSEAVYRQMSFLYM